MLKGMLFGVLFVFALAAVGCDDEDVIKAAAAKGIFLQKKSVEDPPGSGKMTDKYVVVSDPTQSKVDSALGTAQSVAGGIPIAGQAIAGLIFLSSLAGNFLQKKLQAIADQKNADLAAANAQQAATIDTHVATNQATSLALQNFVNAQPPDVGKSLVTHLDTVHDALDVPADLQDTIQPALKPAAA